MSVTRDLKSIYQSITEDAAKQELDLFSGKWDGKHPEIGRYWRAN
ncbi:MAG: putative transposase [Psychroserpens sp.]|jgi:putative transposase